MTTTALIMAGGRGERFWPKSRKNLPKQFLSLTDDGKTMIQLTVERILPLVKLKDIFIATNKAYRELVLEQIPGLPEENILCEPIGRNTAPCIGLGAIHIAQKYDDSIMFVLPSDHLIKFTNSRKQYESCHNRHHSRLSGDRIRLHKVRPAQNRGTGLCCRKICGKAEPRSCQRIFIHRRISLEQRHVYLEGLFYIKKHAETYA